MPLWWGHINKRIFNPREIRKGIRPVLTHVGRSSGTSYQTPLEVERVKNGYLFTLVYGPKSDWVQNVLRAQSASLRVDGQIVELQNPRLLSETEANELTGDEIPSPPKFLRIKEFLRMDITSPA